MKRALISVAVTAAAVTLSAAPAMASPVHHHKVREYRVEPGQSFWKISQKFHVNMVNLAAYNHMNLNGTLYAGIVLRIPPRNWTAPVEETSYTPPATTTYSDTAPTTTYTPPAASSYNPSGVWSCIAEHESSGNPATDTGNGYYGMYQFSMSTWQAAGGTGNPADASAAEQTSVAQRVQQQQGWGAWPVSSAECGV